MYVERNTEAHYSNHCCLGKEITIKYYECVSVFLHLFSAVIYCHVWLLWLCHIFPNYLIYGTVFGKTLLNIKWVFWFSLHLFATFLILKRIQRYIIINLHVFKCPLFLSDFHQIGIFSTGFRQTTKHQISRKNPFSGSLVVPCGETDERTDGRTWRS